MKRPHCLSHFHSVKTNYWICKDIDGNWFVSEENCSACEKAVLRLINSERRITQGSGHIPSDARSSILIRPLVSSRSPSPTELPADIASDYNEACMVLHLSPKASAALSRRCLQHLLRDAAKVKRQDLAKEIDEVLASNTLPTHIAKSIDAITQTGNFAAHPMKSTNKGEIVDVEPHEAEWNLDVLELLFDFYYVQPALTQKKIDIMNAKLASAKKPPMK